MSSKKSQDVFEDETDEDDSDDSSGAEDMEEKKKKRRRRRRRRKRKKKAKKSKMYDAPEHEKHISRHHLSVRERKRRLSSLTNSHRT